VIPARPGPRLTSLRRDSAGGPPAPWKDLDMGKIQQNRRSAAPASPPRVPAEDAREQARRALQTSLDTRQ
jgi:hypothetical protein